MYIQIKATETQVPRPGNPEANSEPQSIICWYWAWQNPTPQTSMGMPTTLLFSAKRKLLNMHRRWISSVHNSSGYLIIGDSKSPDYKKVSLNKSLVTTNVYHPEQVPFETVRKLLNSPVLGISYSSPMLMTELETLKNISRGESAVREAPRGRREPGLLQEGSWACSWPQPGPRLDCVLSQQGHTLPRGWAAGGQDNGCPWLGCQLYCLPTRVCHNSERTEVASVKWKFKGKDGKHWKWNRKGANWEHKKINK